MKEAEFKQLLLPVCDKLYRFAGYLLKNKQEAEDIVQDVLLKLWEDRAQLREIKNPEGWAMTMTKNKCMDKLRSRQRKYRQMEEVKGGVTLPDPHRQAEARDELDRVMQFVHTLPTQQRMVFELRDVEGYTYKEIATITGLSVNAIRVNVSRARKKIRQAESKTYNA